MLEKTYQPADIEARIHEEWMRADAFKAGRPERAKAAPYCIVIPPPNVTGSLHMGHALNNTLQDVLCRFERMRGKDVLWQPGTDHAGIATQLVVERQMMERQEPDRRKIGREKFVEKVWAWKAESGGTIINQLKRLGASCDWCRERFTMDEGLSKAVLKVFVDLYKTGLIYKDKRLVNWDPKFQTAISDLEVEMIEVKGSFDWTRGRLRRSRSMRRRSARRSTAIRRGTCITSAIRWTRQRCRATPRTTSSSPRRGPRRCWATRRSRCIPRTSATSDADRQDGACCRWSAARSRSSPTNTPTPRRARAR